MNIANNQGLVRAVSSDIAWAWVTLDKHIIACSNVL